MAAVQSAASGNGRGSAVRNSILIGLALAMLHGYFASIYIDHLPLYDEMYHMLAAESWRTSGELRILDGEYLRAPLFTKLVGLSANICGPSLECARGISVAASVLLVFLVTVFAGIAMHPAVGFFAGLLVAANPAVIEMAQIVRFYSLHALIFFLFAALVFILTAHWRRLATWQILSFAGLAMVLLWFSNHLQVLTQVGLLGVILGAATILAPDWYGWFRRRNLWAKGLLISIVLAALALGALILDIEGKLQALQSVPLWAKARVHETFFYHNALKAWFPVLWPMMAILAVLSIARWPRLSIYSLVVFVSSLIVLSVAAHKGERFLLYALPFLFLPMAAGITTGLQLFIDFLGQRIRELSGWQAGHPLIAPALGAIVAGTLLLFAINQPIARDAARMVASSGPTSVFNHYSNVADWPSALDEIRQALNKYPVVLTSSGVKAAYYLGDFSFELNRSVLLETDTGAEFGLDPRTGRQVIASIESVLRVARECGPTLVIVDQQHFRHEETLTALDGLAIRQNPAANLLTWEIDPANAVANDTHADSFDREPLDCRPMAL